jgi:hypothetical protein
MYDVPPADNDRETHTGLSHDLYLPVMTTPAVMSDDHL